MVALLLTACGAEEETSRFGELSPGLDYLRKEAVLYRHTASHKDLSFSSEDFLDLTGEATLSEQLISGRLPVLALRGLTVFPDQTIHFDVGRPKSVKPSARE